MQHDLITYKEAAAIVRRSPHTIWRWAQAGIIDVEQLASGQPLVVRASLYKRRRRRKVQT